MCAAVSAAVHVSPGTGAAALSTRRRSSAVLPTASRKGRPASHHAHEEVSSAGPVIVHGSGCHRSEKAIPHSVCYQSG